MPPFDALRPPGHGFQRLSGDEHGVMSEAEPKPAASKSRPRLSWRLLRSLLLVAVAVALAFAGTERLRRKSGEKRCRRDLNYFSQALMNYHAALCHFPPPYLTDSNGRPMHSWRPLLLPLLYCENEIEFTRQYSRYKFSEPWDSSDNTRVRDETKPNPYSCPVYTEGSHNASYLCVVGGVLWPVPNRTGEYWNVPNGPDVREGGVLPSRGKAILLVELVESDIPWTKPEDISLSDLASLLRDDPGGDQFRRRIRNVAAVDAAGTPCVS